MDFNFITGDKVLYINDNDTGTILMFIGNTKVKLLNNSGFEEIVLIKDIIPLPINNNDITSYRYAREDLTFEINEYTINENKYIQFSNDKHNKLYYKADLHIQNLIEHYKHLDSIEIIHIQLNRCLDCIAEVKLKGIPVLKLIHGIGKGTLKNKIHRLLDDNKLEFSDAYGYTEVIIS